jgi:hypothetical protein
MCIQSLTTPDYARAASVTIALVHLQVPFEDLQVDKYIGRYPS